MVLSALYGMTIGDQPDFLPPDVLAQYEAGFRVIAINATKEKYLAGDLELRNAVEHELYHHLQAVCSGYGWRRSARIREIVMRHVNAAAKRDWKANKSWYRAIKFLGWLPKSFDPEGRLTAVCEFYINANRAAALSQSDPTDPSLAATEYPGLFHELEALRSELWTVSADGLADGHIIEGAAIANAVLLDAVTTEGPNALSVDRAEALDKAILQLAEPLGAEYSSLCNFSRKWLSGPSSLRLLPAAALSLRYERPACAFPKLVSEFPHASYKVICDHAAGLAGQLPRIAGAGAILGTARELINAEKKQWRLPWKKPLDIIQFSDEAPPSWELGFLTDASYVRSTPLNSFACVVRFNDSVEVDSSQDLAFTLASLPFASVALRAQTRGAIVNDLDARMRAWIMDVGSRVGFYTPITPEQEAETLVQLPSSGPTQHGLDS
jgi:hypothetical protein